jgi:hypothetical protein
MVPALPLLYPLPYLFANVSPLPATFTNYPGKNGSLPYLAEAYLRPTAHSDNNNIKTQAVELLSSSPPMPHSTWNEYQAYPPILSTISFGLAFPRFSLGLNSFSKLGFRGLILSTATEGTQYDNLLESHCDNAGSRREFPQCEVRPGIPRASPHRHSSRESTRTFLARAYESYVAVCGT